MHISYQWLCELIPGLEKISPVDLAKKLTMSGLEVEEFIDQAAFWRGIVVGEVMARDKHPNADKLSLCRVNSGTEILQVVCGAPNVTAGKKYPFATLGTKMPEGLEIKPVKLRGVDSFGMLCSARELKLSEEHAGLYELPADAKVGEPVADLLHHNDVILGLNITPNRGDALGHWGVARDIAALTGLAPAFTTQSLPGGSGATAIKVALEDAKACPRYSVSRIKGVKVGESPQWLKSRLEALGQRSINNVVDATNAVMLLTGHPVHAFDARQLEGDTIRIRSLLQPQKFKTLDKTERDLLPGDLVIEDAKKAVALAGIMGGENSEVAVDTQELVLEVAFFAPETVRKTSRRLGLQTESSYRFSRFVNPDTIVRAHQELQALIISLAGGTPSAIEDFYPVPYAKKSLQLTEAEIVRMLGINVPEADVVRILTGLDCRVQKSGTTYAVEIPIARSDLERPIDLVEEIIRVYGMDHIPESMPVMAVRSSQEDAATLHEREIKTFFIERGFNESVHYSFGDADHFAKVLRVSVDKFFKLKNPLSEDLAVMRPSLLPQLIACYKKNHLNTDKGLRLFECRKVYDASGIERRVLAALFTGNPLGRNPYGLQRVSDFHDGKGLLTGLFAKARMQTADQAYEEWPFHGGQASRFDFRGKLLATVGALHPELLQELKLRDRLYYLEIDYDTLAGYYRQALPKFIPVGTLPPVHRDVAFLAPRELTHAEIYRTLMSEKPAILKHVELFDQYEGPNLPLGKKSLAYSLIYQPEGEESLTDETVNKLHFEMVDKLKNRLGVELR